ncbi:MAG: hypothetical protein WCK06_08315, partial [Actinomycetota bacterium]
STGGSTGATVTGATVTGALVAGAAATRAIIIGGLLAASESGAGGPSAAPIPSPQMKTPTTAITSGLGAASARHHATEEAATPASTAEIDELVARLADWPISPARRCVAPDLRAPQSKHQR